MAGQAAPLAEGGMERLAGVGLGRVTPGAEAGFLVFAVGIGAEGRSGGQWRGGLRGGPQHPDEQGQQRDGGTQAPVPGAAARVGGGAEVGAGVVHDAAIFLA